MLRGILSESWDSQTLARRDGCLPVMSYGHLTRLWVCVAYVRPPIRMTHLFGPADIKPSFVQRQCVVGFLK